jgi:hypothetical protein
MGSAGKKEKIKRAEEGNMGVGCEKQGHTSLGNPRENRTTEEGK